MYANKKLLSVCLGSAVNYLLGRLDKLETLKLRFIKIKCSTEVFKSQTERETFS